LFIVFQSVLPRGKNHRTFVQFYRTRFAFSIICITHSFVPFYEKTRQSRKQLTLCGIYRAQFGEQNAAYRIGE